MLGILLQLTSFLEVIPAWLPPLVISIGFILLCFGMGRQYWNKIFTHQPALSGIYSAVSVACLTFGIAGAMFTRILEEDLALLFVLFTFISGRIVQGAISARIIQKIINLFLTETRSSNPIFLRVLHYIWDKFKKRIVMMLVTSFILLYTTLSIAAVYLLNSGSHFEAIERFWIGVIYLTISGLVYDARHYAHRTSWIPALGLIVITTGSLLYNPAGLSSFTEAMTPFLQNPIPEWMRLPLGAFGFLIGVLIWALFYTNQSSEVHP